MLWLWFFGLIVIPACVLAVWLCVSDPVIIRYDYYLDEETDEEWEERKRRDEEVTICAMVATISCM